MGTLLSDLGIVLGEQCQPHHFSINAAFKLHGEVCHIIAPNSRFIDARGKDELTVCRHIHTGGSNRHGEILDELNTSSEACRKRSKVDFTCPLRW
jgi:hypothetical protein